MMLVFLLALGIALARGLETGQGLPAADPAQGHGSCRADGGIGIDDSWDQQWNRLGIASPTQ